MLPPKREGVVVDVVVDPNNDKGAAAAVEDARVDANREGMVVVVVGAKSDVVAEVGVTPAPNNVDVGAAEVLPPNNEGVVDDFGPNIDVDEVEVAPANDGLVLLPAAPKRDEPVEEVAEVPKSEEVEAGAPPPNNEVVGVEPNKDVAVVEAVAPNIPVDAGVEPKMEADGVVLAANMEEVVVAPPPPNGEAVDGTELKSGGAVAEVEAEPNRDGIVPEVSPVAAAVVPPPNDAVALLAPKSVDEDDDGLAKSCVELTAAKEGG